MLLTSENYKSISAILKKRFPNLTVDETVDIAGQILDSIKVKS